MSLLNKIQFGGETYYACPGRARYGPGGRGDCIPLTSQQLTDELRLHENVDDAHWYVEKKPVAIVSPLDTGRLECWWATACSCACWCMLCCAFERTGDSSDARD